MMRAKGPATRNIGPGRSAIIGDDSTTRSNQRLPSWQVRMVMAPPMEWPSAKIGGGQSGKTISRIKVSRSVSYSEKSPT